MAGARGRRTPECPLRLPKVDCDRVFQLRRAPSEAEVESSRPGGARDARAPHAAAPLLVLRRAGSPRPAPPGHARPRGTADAPGTARLPQAARNGGRSRGPGCNGAMESPTRRPPGPPLLGASSGRAAPGGGETETRAGGRGAGPAGGGGAWAGPGRGQELPGSGGKGEGGAGSGCSGGRVLRASWAAGGVSLGKRDAEGLPDLALKSLVLGRGRV